MHPHLNALVAQLGLPEKLRYSLEETAEILGIRRDQVLDLLKRGKLLGKRASERRWSGILAEDLDGYLETVNAPREKRHRHHPSAAAVAMTTPIPAPSPPSSVLVTAVPPASPPTPRNHDPCGALPIYETPSPALTLKPKLNF